jgi:flagellar hook-length control protein FliK
MKGVTCLDITQITIKINQTTKLDGGKPTSITQADTPVNSFDKILAMFNLFGKSPESDRPPAASSLHNNLSDELDIDQTNPANSSTADWKKLDAIFAAWVVEIQQGQYSQAAQQYPLENQFSASESQPSGVSDVLSSLQNGTEDVSNALAQWLQKMEGINQTSTLDPQLMQRFAQSIGESLSQEKQKTIQVPDGIQDKIQTILEGLKIENTFGVRIPANIQSYENESFFDDKKQDGSLVSKPADVPLLVPSLPNKSDKTDNDQSNPTNLSAEDWWKLDTILTSWISEKQQGPYSQIAPQQLLENHFSASEPQLPPVISAVLSPHQQAVIEDRNAMVQWIQNVDGINQTSKMDPSQLMERLAQLIGKLQSQEKQKLFEIPNGIDSKIQTILDGLKTENTFGVRIPFNSQFHEKGLDDGKKQDVSLETKPLMSLDKNQLLFSSKTGQGPKIDEESRFVQVPLTKPVEDRIKLNGWTLMANHQLQGSDGGNVSKSVPPPILPVSEFVPEVSQWIGRYMRVTNDQSGSTEAKFSLYPEHLGHIEIKITSQQGQVSAQIVTDTTMAKEALEGQLQYLRQALQQHGVLVQKLEIIQQTPVFMDSNQANLSFSQGGSGSSQEQRTFNSDQVVSKKQKEAEELEIERETLSLTYGGATMTASSIDFSA